MIIATTTPATHGLNSTISHGQDQDACLFQDVRINHPSYGLLKSYVKEEDALSSSTCQTSKIPLNFDNSQQEYVPIESVCHLLINDVHNVHNESAGNRYIAKQAL